MTDATLPPLDGIALSAAERQAVTAAIAAASFDGKAGSTLSLRGIGAHPRILLVGTGATPSSLALAEAGGKAAQELKSEAYPVTIGGAFGDSSAADVAYGFALGQYRFDRYKTVDKKAPPTGAVTIVGANASAAEAAFAGRWKPLAEGVRLSRDLANEPANVIYPESFVARVARSLCRHTRRHDRGARRSRDAQARHGHARRGRSGQPARVAAACDTVSRRRRSSGADRALSARASPSIRAASR
jgi:leucyl aminopeptidase